MNKSSGFTRGDVVCPFLYFGVWRVQGTGFHRLDGSLRGSLGFLVLVYIYGGKYEEP